MKIPEEEMSVAARGSSEEISMLLYHPSPHVLSRLLLNSNLTEDHVRVLARRNNLTGEMLESIYYDRRWKDCYPVMLALCKNPKTPQNISLSILKSLRIFDLADLTRNQQIPLVVRMRAEINIIERILTLPLGIKITLARRASSAVLVRLLEDGMKEVSSVCLDSPIITEGDICRIVSMKKTSSQVIRQIAEHPKWSRRYDVRWALLRNPCAPLAIIVNFLKDMKTTDLQELYHAPEVPSSTKPFLYRELLDRGHEP
ncbi:MAG: hypothetical protein ACOYVJ_07035 [Nitrospirota bacterium]